jgi:dolichol kinase
MLQLQFIITPIIFAVLASASIACALIGRRTSRRDRWLGGDWTFGATAVGAAAAVTLLALLIMLIPFDGKYFMINERTGTVATVSNQFVNGTGDSTSQSFIVTLEGNKTPYELTDNRASVLDGKDVTLVCTTEFVYMGADRENCVIGQVR